MNGKEGAKIRSCQICGRLESETRIIKTRDYGCLCRKHYLQYYRHGKFFTTIYDANEVITYTDYAEIVLRGKDGKEVGRAKVDLDDIKNVSEHKWHMTKNGRNKYAMTHLEGNKKIFMHRMIMDYKGNLDIDHINHDGLDNRKSNLRIVSHSQNMLNEYREGRGIVIAPSGNYIAQITVNGKYIYLGTYETYEEAICERQTYENTMLT